MIPPRQPPVSTARTLVRLKFAWDSESLACTAVALDVEHRPLASTVIELDPAVREEIWRANHASARLRIEDLAEQHLRQLLRLRN